MWRKNKKKLFISRTKCDIFVLKTNKEYKENQEISIQKSKLPDELYYFVQHWRKTTSTLKLGKGLKQDSLTKPQNI